ncbi:MAG: DUF354 domain-containing protein [Bacteroidales bacterium]|nr:DUF354 domain-containing protein [Bacteroidales bacterium]
MKILVDLIHPANIHYFKHFIRKMSDNNHSLVITARNKDVLQKLLKAYKIDYIDTGKGSIGKGPLGKMLYLFFAEFCFLYLLLKFKPDITLSFGSAPLSHISWLFKIPHISFDDTEHAKLNKKLYVPFTSLVISPNCFYDNLGKNHIKFDGYMELFYLHKNCFQANKSILKELGINRNEPYVFIRFVNWKAFHDIDQKGISNENKIKLVKLIRKYAKVFISSEGEIPEELHKYRISVSPEKIHNVLAFSKLYIGEGGTMASECAMLGVPSIYINSLPLMGYLKDAKEAGLLYHLANYKEIEKQALNILNNKNNDYKKIRNMFLKNKIDSTAFLIWLIENYPESKKILKENSDFQYKFM